MGFNSFLERIAETAGVTGRPGPPPAREHGGKVLSRCEYEQGAAREGAQRGKKLVGKTPMRGSDRDRD